MSLSVEHLAYAHPGGTVLFDDVSFKVPAGTVSALVGGNGVGKTTLMRLVAKELTPLDGEIAVSGEVHYLPQDLGIGSTDVPIRLMLTRAAPSHVRAAGEALADVEARLAAGDDAAAFEIGDALERWGALGGYQLEAMWDEVCRRVLGAGLSEVGDRLISTMSGGERKRLVLDAVFETEPAVLLLDEPDNFLDIPAKEWLQERLAATKATVLLISHDRELLCASPKRIVTLEASGAWVHGESYTTYDDASFQRQERLAADRSRWEEEERRLFHFYKIMKQRAASSGNSSRADAAETRWKRYVEAGPPPAPAPRHRITPNLVGADSGRIALRCDDLEVDGLVLPFTAEVHFGDRVGLVGPNGTGKSHLMRTIAGELAPSGGSVTLGARINLGYFSQMNRRAEFEDNELFDIARGRVTTDTAAMGALGRYGLATASDRLPSTLSGGQRARLDVMCLELDGCNLLLLDEPTDNLDLESSEVLQEALEGFTGTVIAVSHDRAFLRSLSTFWHLDEDGIVREFPEIDLVMPVLTGRAAADSVKHARVLTV
ncbi:MAG TPA: ATP-binding cassette domain-containing protein [Microthrixaceae bacterium]|nr:ATP-binding cassette domain-containing protein [Microthrixaceae bacterium]